MTGPQTHNTRDDGYMHDQQLERVPPQPLKRTPNGITHTRLYFCLTAPRLLEVHVSRVCLGSRRISFEICARHVAKSKRDVACPVGPPSAPGTAHTRTICYTLRTRVEAITFFKLHTKITDY